MEPSRGHLDNLKGLDILHVAHGPHSSLPQAPLTKLKALPHDYKPQEPQ